MTERGGPTSHTAIIARQLGIPCVVGAAGAIAVMDGRTALVDGQAGTVEVDPEHDKAATLVAEDRAERAALASWSGPGRTADGHPVKLLANVADAASARAASTEPVTGIGLFRTELCFLDRETEPSVEEQAEIYAGVLEPYTGDRHVVVRTLDAGSDKPVAFATRPDEENPALGRPRPAARVRRSRTPPPPARRDRHRCRPHRHGVLGDGADGRHRRRGARLRCTRYASAASSPE